MNEQQSVIDKDYAEREVLVQYFREGLYAFLAAGDRAEMIAFAAKYCQEKDEPRQREIEKVWEQNRETLAKWDW